MSKMRPNKWNPAYPYDHLKADIARYDIICGIGDDAHFAPDYRMGLELGWGGLLEKIAACRKLNPSPGQQHFYDLHDGPSGACRDGSDATLPRLNGWRPKSPMPGGATTCWPWRRSTAIS